MLAVVEHQEQRLVAKGAGKRVRDGSGGMLRDTQRGGDGMRDEAGIGETCQFHDPRTAGEVRN